MENLYVKTTINSSVAYLSSFKNVWVINLFPGQYIKGVKQIPKSTTETKVSFSDLPWG